MEHPRLVDIMVPKSAAERLRLTLKNVGLTFVDLAKRLKRPPRTVKHWLKNGIPKQYLTIVAAQLKESTGWLSDGCDVPFWYLRHVVEGRDLHDMPVKVPAALLCEARMGVLAERLVQHLQYNPSPLVLPGGPFTRSTFFRTQGFGYLDCLEEADLEALAEMLDIPTRYDMKEAYITCRTMMAQDRQQEPNHITDTIELSQWRKRTSDQARDRDIAMQATEFSDVVIRRKILRDLRDLVDEFKMAQLEALEPPESRIVRAKHMFDIQNKALALLNNAVTGEGLVSGTFATELLRGIYGIAEGIGLIGSRHMVLERAVAISIGGMFNNRIFRLNELISYLHSHFSFTITRSKGETTAEATKTAKVFTNDELLIRLRGVGARCEGQLWSTIHSEPGQDLSRA